MKTKMKNFVLPFLASLVLSPFLIGCEEITQDLSSKNFYEKDMIIIMDGVAREGMITMPLKPIHQLRVIARGDLDMFVMADCEGVGKKEKAWNVTEQVRGGFLGWGTRTIANKREVTFEYHTTELNRDGACPVHLYGFSKEGKHSEGYFDFQSDKFQLMGEMRCNKVTRAFEGVEACQTQTGIFTSLKFEEEVFLSPSKGCEIPVTSGKEFRFRQPLGFCTYRIEAWKSKKVGRFVTYGSNGTLIRE